MVSNKQYRIQSATIAPKTKWIRLWKRGKHEIRPVSESRENEPYVDIQRIAVAQSVCMDRSAPFRFNHVRVKLP